jgi:spermidine synthase
MIPWQLLDRVRVPAGPSGKLEQELSLYRRGEELSIRIGGTELMNSRMHGSEDVLAERACARIVQDAGAHPQPAVLIGGLGMGFTLRAALQHLPSSAEVVVAELLPSVVRWNESHLGHLAGHPLRDARVRVQEGDVAEVLRASRAAFDAIVLDVDNGPEGLVRASNAWLYARAGLEAVRRALRPRGVLAVWSVQRDQAFEERLRAARFEVETLTPPARMTAGRGKGARHVVWLATPEPATSSPP